MSGGQLGGCNYCTPARRSKCVGGWCGGSSVIMRERQPRPGGVLGGELCLRRPLWGVCVPRLRWRLPQEFGGSPPLSEGGRLWGPCRGFSTFSLWAHVVRAGINPYCGTLFGKGGLLTSRVTHSVGCVCDP